ncbi:MAG: PIG-L family deacetylase [Chloroflexota bacterium]|nr:PIG-L family deacetylase [Chloroflexota bacterium]
MYHVYLSPHFDDVALSCGGMAAAHTAAGGRGRCITVFAAPLPPGTPLSAYVQGQHQRWGDPDAAAANRVRRSEEAAAMACLGLDLTLLDYPDAIYRADRYPSDAHLFGPLHAAEVDLPARLAADLTVILGALDPAGLTIYAPLGLGRHVDHQIVFQAARHLAGAGWTVQHYEDYPYAAKPAAHATRFAELGLPAAGPAAPPIYYDITATLEAKIAAIAAYPSQLSGLFDPVDTMPAAVRAYAAAVAAGWGGAAYAERCRRLDSPAPGAL